MSRVALGNLCTYANGGTPAKLEPSYWGGPHSWITSTEIQNGSILPARSAVTDRGISESATTLVPAGTVLLVTRTGVGKLAITRKQLCFSQDITAIFPDEKRLNRDYLAWFLRGQEPYFAQHSRGATIKGITREALNRLEIPLPPLAEQKRIAGILDAADALRAKRREALAQLDTLLQATFLDLFGDPVTNPKAWEVRSLSELASVQRGKFTPRPRNDPSFYEGEYPFIQTGDIANSGGYVTTWRQTLNESGTKVSKCFLPGTIAFAIVGATIGRTAILSITAYCPDSVVGITARPNVATPVYLEAVLRSRRDELLKRAPQTARANLNLEILKPFPVASPPFELQSRYQQIVQSAERQKSRMRAHIDELDTLFSSLQSRAFRDEH